MSRSPAKRPIIVALAAALATGAGLGAARLVGRRKVEAGPDSAWWAQGGAEPPAAHYRGCVRTSRYLTMRDGVRIAIDLYLPKDLPEGAKLPTILHQTRYYRRMELRWPFSLLGSGPHRSIHRFVSEGYALVSVDARGSGASFGTRAQEWSPDEVRDGAEVVDWIVRQPWSDGQVGATGISYDGTCAEFVATTRHPAVKAIAPRFALFDAYADIAFPGGIHQTHFTKTWGRGNLALDLGHLDELGGWRARLAGSRVAAVDEDPGRGLANAAMLEHSANYDVHETATRLTFRDDVSESGLTLDRLSTHTQRDAVEASGIAVYSYSGWCDGAYSWSAATRHRTLSNPGNRLTFGPWPHAGFFYLAPFFSKRPTGFDHDGELLRFFGHHLKGSQARGSQAKGVQTGIDAEPPVHYYTTGEDRWKAALTWPPATELVPHYFAAEGVLSSEKPADSTAHDVYRVDLSAGTGQTSRWDSLTNAIADYPDRAEADRKLLTYTSPPLATDTEVTGHPLVALYVASTAEDGQFFAYLEDVAPDGRVGYVAEGLLRALHRKVSDEPPYRTPVPYHSFRRADALPLVPGDVAELRFDLLPLSHLFRRGHRIRIALAGADRDHFAPLRGDPPTLRVHRGGDYASRVDLPIIPRS